MKRCLSRMRGKLSRTVLRRGKGSNPFSFVEYTSESVRNMLIKEGIRRSFSRFDMPGDNSWSESFFANLKKEAVHWVHFRTRAEARLKIFNHIEGFYNTRRIQKRLGYISPIQWLIRWNQCLQTRVA